MNMKESFRVFGPVTLLAALAIAVALFGPDHKAKALNQSGALAREEPFSFWQSISLSDSTLYGPLGGNKAIDGVFFNATAGQTLVVNDQSGNSVTWTIAQAGTYFLPISPSKFPLTGGSTATGIIAAYK